MMDDDLIAAALRGESPEWPPKSDPATVVERAVYHGVASLILAKAPQWPGAVMTALRSRAIAQAMWEMRHRMIVTQLLSGLTAAGVRTVILKGTALAYDLYPDPAARSRGDTDLLIAPADLERARAVLRDMGYVCAFGLDQIDDGHLQEPWTVTTADGQSHDIDLHWQVLNAATLGPVITLSDAMDNTQPLPRLCLHAQAMPRVQTLLHAAAHRATHVTSPYFVGGAIHYGGDRLIWLCDIDLLARAFTASEWDDLCKIAAERGVGPVCLEGLQSARVHLGTPVPLGVIDRLTALPAGPATTYLTGSRQVGRAWQDLGAKRGLIAKSEFILARIFPPEPFLRAKYPDLSQRPLPLLYLRRMIDFFRSRGSSSK